MKKLTLLVLFLPHFILCQKVFTKDEIDFAKYLIAEQSLAAQYSDTLVITLLKEYQISSERYAEILKSGFNGQVVQYSENEKKFKEKIHNMNVDLKERKEKVITDFLKNVGWTDDKLRAMMTKYKTESAFREGIQQLLQIEKQN